MRSYLIVILAIICLALPIKSETYVVCVGISEYASPKVKNLRLPVKDAKDVAAFYRKATDNVTSLTGKDATKSEILKCLRNQFDKASETDKIIFFFSGHGYPGGFCPYEMTCIEEGLSYKEVISIMAKSRAKGKFIFADACNSGAIRQTGKKPAKPQTNDVLLFLSSRGSEYSIELKNDDNGMFTKFLLMGLKGGADNDRNRIVTAKELFLFVSENVKKRSGGRQHPVMWGKFDDNLKIVEYKRK
ncbi:MAG: caspase family protein [Muribaculaceae bacterium]|nr:caspase family protein [Muribaculaceae bacterium]